MNNLWFHGLMLAAVLFSVLMPEKPGGMFGIDSRIGIKLLLFFGAILLEAGYWIGRFCMKG